MICLYKYIYLTAAQKKVKLIYVIDYNMIYTVEQKYNNHFTKGCTEFKFWD